MVIVSHDREFLDQLCTKIVEVERGMARASLPQPSAPPDPLAPRCGDGPPCSAVQGRVT